MPLEVEPARLPQIKRTASRVNPTCSDERGHDYEQFSSTLGACGRVKSSVADYMIARTIAANAADGCHALVPGRETAIRRTAHAASVDRAPRVRIIGQGFASVCASTTVDRASAASTIVRMRIANSFVGSA